MFDLYRRSAWVRFLTGATLIPLAIAAGVSIGVGLACWRFGCGG